MDNPFSTTKGKAAIARRLPPNFPSETIDDYIADAWAKSTGVAPCIAEDNFPVDKEDDVVAILRAVILRWAEAGTGAATVKTAGPYAITLDDRPRRGPLLYPAEIVDLQKLCQSRRSYSFDTTPDEDPNKSNPLYGVIVNGDASFNGPPGEWADSK